MLLQYLSWGIVFFVIVIFLLVFNKYIAPQNAYIALQIMILSVCVINILSITRYKFDVVFDYNFKEITATANIARASYLAFSLSLAINLVVTTT